MSIVGRIFLRIGVPCWLSDQLAFGILANISIVVLVQRYLVKLCPALHLQTNEQYRQQEQATPAVVCWSIVPAERAPCVNNALVYLLLSDSVPIRRRRRSRCPRFVPFNHQLKYFRGRKNTGKDAPRIASQNLSLKAYSWHSRVPAHFWEFHCSHCF